jgi:hypothetical protein
MVGKLIEGAKKTKSAPQIFESNGGGFHAEKT